MANTIIRFGTRFTFDGAARSDSGADDIVFVKRISGDLGVVEVRLVLVIGAESTVTTVDDGVQQFLHILRQRVKGCNKG